MQDGFTQSKADYSLFTKHTDLGFIAVLVYGNDIIIESGNKGLIDQFKASLNSHFKLKDRSNLQYFFDLEIAWSSQSIMISQRKLVLELLEKYGILGAKPSSIPVEVTSKLIHSDNNVQLVGTRRDLAYGVHILSHFMDKPTQFHIDAAYRLLRYLKGTPGQGLFLSSTSDLKLVAYSDSDWAGCQETRRSLTDSCIFIGSSLTS